MVKSNKAVPLKPAQRARKSPVSGTVPNRKANDALRTRSHLTEKEVERLLKVAKQGRYGQRDHLMVLMAFRHGLRVSELCDLQWTDIEFRRGTVHVRRLKGSKESTHYLEADESRPLKALHKASESRYVFTSERGGPMSAAGFRKQLARWGVKAKLRFPVNPHMLRHACFELCEGNIGEPV